MGSAFSSASAMIQAMTTTGQHIGIMKDARVGASAAVATVSGQMTSLWQYNGNPSDGAAPTTVAIPTSATAGSLHQSDAAAGSSLYLMSASFVAQAAGTIILYDRLLHIGNLSGTVTTAQIVGGAITRYTGGTGNQIWVEIYTQIGTTGTTIQATYTNDLGVGGQLSQLVTIGGTGFREAQRLLQLPLASGDTGVSSVQSVKLTGTTGTAGAFGVTLVHQLGTYPMGVADCATVRGYSAGIPDFPLIQPAACLAMAFLANTTTSPQIHGHLHMAQQ